MKGRIIIYLNHGATLFWGWQISVFNFFCLVRDRYLTVDEKFLVLSRIILFLTVCIRCLTIHKKVKKLCFFVFVGFLFFVLLAFYGNLPSLSYARLSAPASSRSEAHFV
jgi:hypothetical protein